jgi:hypothetical protein
MVIFGLAMGLAGCATARRPAMPSLAIERVATAEPSDAKDDDAAANAANPADGTPYRLLFDAGRTWSYRVEASRSWWDDQDPRADAQGSVHEAASGEMICRVAEVRALAAGVIAAELGCEGAANIPVHPSSPSGVYVATGAGLWRFDTYPAEGVLATLDPDKSLMARAPVPRSIEEKDGEQEGFGAMFTVMPAGDGGWCSESLWVGGDEGGWRLCFEPGRGLVSGGAHFAGGSYAEYRFELER